MIDNSKVKNFVYIINSLVDSETQPLRSDAWLLPTLQDRRRSLWKEMTDDEKQLARTMLGERAKWC